MKCLYLIPARGGSKGIPKKNIKLFNGKPLIHYSIEIAKKLADSKDICVSTDSEEIKKVAEQTGINIPFIRPADLATDKAGSSNVIKHAVEFYKAGGVNYDAVILLQPTSPFRLIKHVKEAITIFEDDLDMVCSVSESKANPYYNLFEESDNGILKKCKQGSYIRRQDCPAIYEQNGSIYVISVKSLLTKGMANFTKTKKYVMNDIYSRDIDTPDDWDYCEYLLQHRKVKYE